MDEEERKELSAKRKKELAEKELQKDLHRDMRMEAIKNRQLEVREETENKFVNKAIIFLGTLIPLYILLFGAKLVFTATFGTAASLMGVSTDWIGPMLHMVVWALSILSIIRDRSALDDIMDYMA